MERTGHWVHGKRAWVDQRGQMFTTRTGNTPWSFVPSDSEDSEDKSSAKASGRTATKARARSRSRSRANKPDKPVSKWATVQTSFRGFAINHMKGLLIFFFWVTVLVAWSRVTAPTRPTEVGVRADICDAGVQASVASCLSDQSYRKCWEGTRLAIANGGAQPRMVKTCKKEDVAHVEDCVKYTAIGKWYLNHTLTTTTTSVDFCSVMNVTEAATDSGLYCIHEPRGMIDGCASIIASRELRIIDALEQKTLSFLAGVAALRKNWAFVVVGFADPGSVIATRALISYWADGTVTFTVTEVILSLVNLIWACFYSRFMIFNMVLPAVGVLLTVARYPSWVNFTVATISGASAMCFSPWSILEIVGNYMSPETYTQIVNDHRLPNNTPTMLIRIITSRGLVKVVVDTIGFQVMIHIMFGIANLWVMGVAYW